MFAKSIVLAAALFSAASPALAWGDGNGWNNNGWHQNNGGWHNNGGWNNGGWNNGGGWNQPPTPQAETVTISLDRFVANETLRLRQLAGLNAQVNGRRLQSVNVSFNPGPSARVQLLVNGQVASEGYSGGKSRLELRPNGNANTFGSQIQTLQLRVIGWASIDDIQINVLRQANWQPQPPQVSCQTLERHLNTRVSFRQISLNELFSIGQLNGCRIGSVTLTGFTDAGFGQAVVLVNGSAATNSVQVARQPGVYVLNFANAPAAGNRAPQLALNLNGNFMVQSVRLNLVNGGGW